jgi:uncharacterized membrane protein YcfT
MERVQVEAALLLDLLPILAPVVVVVALGATEEMVELSTMEQPVGVELSVMEETVELVHLLGVVLGVVGLVVMGELEIVQEEEVVVLS